VSEAAGPSRAEEERIARELADQLRQLRVEDVLINTLVTVSSIGYRRLGLTPETVEDRDLEQARLAIETMRAVTPVLENFVPGDLVRDFNQSVANLQLAYAKAAAEAAASGSGQERAQSAESASEPTSRSGDEAAESAESSAEPDGGS
jgi:hypothetical protein